MDDENKNNNLNPNENVDDQLKEFDQGQSGSYQSLNPSSKLKDMLGNNFLSQVSSAKSSKGLMVIALASIVGFGGYTIVTNISTKEEQEKASVESQKKQKGDVLLKTAEIPVAVPDDTSINSAGNTATTSLARKDNKLPEAPPISTPQPPEAPPPPVPAAPPAPVMDSSKSAPTLPPLGNVAAGAPPTAVPGSSDASVVDSLTGEAEKKRKAAEDRRKSSIMVLGGDGGALAIATGGSSSKDKKDSKDSSAKGGAQNQSLSKGSSFLGFGNGQLASAGGRTSGASSVQATSVGDLDKLIAQGKIMNAILETAINTDLPGSLRAIVTRDVYAESGKNILIPKGSRLVGTYSADAKPGQDRVGIIWDRLIRPDGVDIAIKSIGTDNLGRSGIEGDVDDKFWLKIGSAVLTSYVIPSIVKKITNQSNTNATQTTSTTPNAATGVATTTNTTTAQAQQAQDSLKKMQDITEKSINDTISTKPTITIDQGTKVSVYVNQDLVFPPEYVNGGSKVLR